MDKKYNEPIIEITLFESVDVITASGEDDYLNDAPNYPNLVQID